MFNYLLLLLNKINFMKSNFMIEDNILTNLSVEDIGNDHLYTSLETPMVADAFSILITVPVRQGCSMDLLFDTI